MYLSNRKYLIDELETNDPSIVIERTHTFRRPLSVCYTGIRLTGNGLQRLALATVMVDKLLY